MDFYQVVSCIHVCLSVSVLLGIYSSTTYKPQWDQSGIRLGHISPSLHSIKTLLAFYNLLI